MSKETWIERIREHANIHYEENGWDILVETWMDEDIIEVIDECESYEEAVYALVDILSTINEYREDMDESE
jgi:ribosomal protein L12E/L44/L45/RPP1/RPP2